MGDTGFEPCDLPYLAPYMAAAVGIALGATRPKDRRIDLTPLAKRAASARDPKRLLVGVGAVVLVGALGAMFVNGRGAIADEQRPGGDRNGRTVRPAGPSSRNEMPQRIRPRAQMQPAVVALSLPPTLLPALRERTSIGSPWRRPSRAGSAPLGISVTSFQGVFDPPAAPVASVAVDVTEVVPAEPVAPAPVEPALQGPIHVGTLTMSATAPSLAAIADCLDSIAADTHFTDAWASGISMIAQPDGSTSVQFTMEIDLTDENLVDGGTAARGSRMTRSPKDKAMLIAMGVLVLFAAYNFLIRPQGATLAPSATSEPPSSRSVSDAQVGSAGTPRHLRCGICQLRISGSRRSRQIRRSLHFSVNFRRLPTTRACCTDRSRPRRLERTRPGRVVRYRSRSPRRGPTRRLWRTSNGCATSSDCS